MAAIVCSLGLSMSMMLDPMADRCEQLALRGLIETRLLALVVYGVGQPLPHWGAEARRSPGFVQEAEPRRSIQRSDGRTRPGGERDSLEQLRQLGQGAGTPGDGVQ